ncbi:MAG: hypothetical protein ACR2OU_06920 [Thermomicrobiales bacterium]
MNIHLVIDINLMDIYYHSMNISSLPHQSPFSASRPLLKTVTVAAAILYTVVWIVGLFVPVPALSVHSSHLKTWDKYAGNTTALIQALLVHGLAAILLAIVALSTARAVAQSTDERGTSRSRWIVGSGLVSAALSLIQFVIEASLVVGILGVNKSNAHDFWLAVNRLDGIKMFALAALVAAFAGIDAKSHVNVQFLPSWIRIVNVLTAIALILSGIGYALMNAPLMLAAWASLPLLLISVTATGIVTGRHLGDHGK